MRTGAVAAVLLASLLGAAPALAQGADPSPADVERARTLFEEGVARADEQRWGEAVELFRRALAIVERPSIVFNLGVALFRLGRAREAAETLERFIEISDAIDDAADVATARQHLAEIGRATGTLTIRVTPVEATIQVDGVPTGSSGADRRLTLDPGTHSVEVTAERYRPARFDLSVLPGEATTREVTLERIPGPPTVLAVNAPGNAAIQLDGETVGRGSVELEVTPGLHEVVVGEFERDFEIAEGERLVIDAAGESGGIATKAWFWGLIAGVVVAAAAAITIGIVLTSNQDPLADYQGTTNWTFEALTGAGR